MQNIDYDLRRHAWQHFKIAVEYSVPNHENGEIIRLCRIFSTAPQEEQKSWEVLISAASRLGHKNAAKRFGQLLYQWSGEKSLIPAYLAAIVSTFF